MPGKISEMGVMTAATAELTDKIEVLDVSDTTMASTGTNKGMAYSEIIEFLRLQGAAIPPDLGYNTMQTLVWDKWSGTPIWGEPYSTNRTTYNASGANQNANSPGATFNFNSHSDQTFTLKAASDTDYDVGTWYEIYKSRDWTGTLTVVAGATTYLNGVMAGTVEVPKGFIVRIHKIDPNGYVVSGVGPLQGLLPEGANWNDYDQTGVFATAPPLDLVAQNAPSEGSYGVLIVSAPPGGFDIGGGSGMYVNEILSQAWYAGSTIFVRQGQKGVGTDQDGTVNWGSWTDVSFYRGYVANGDDWNTFTRFGVYETEAVTGTTSHHAPPASATNAGVLSVIGDDFCTQVWATLNGNNPADTQQWLRHTSSTAGVWGNWVQNLNTGTPIRRPIKNVSATSYAPVLADENVMITFSNAAAITATMPSNATTAFVVGAEIEFMWLGVGQPTFVAGSGATVNGTPGLKIIAQYGVVTAKKVSTNGWVVRGDLSA